MQKHFDILGFGNMIIGEKNIRILRRPFENNIN